MGAVTGIFNASDYSALRKARLGLSEMIAKMDRAKACGVDCAQYAAMRDDIDAQLAAIEQHFMTPAPVH